MTDSSFVPFLFFLVCKAVSHLSPFFSFGCYPQST
jgi:hypothetical protein